MTQGEASLVVRTLGEGTVSSRRHLSAAEAPVTESRGERPSWQERMGLSLAEALRLPGLEGTEVVAGPGGLDRVVRYMVVDDPADPLAVAGPDVLVVLGARLPPADAANCRALVERLDSMGTAGLAYRRAEGPPPVPVDVLAEADRRALPVLALPATVRMGEVVSEVLGAVVGKQSEALALSSRMHDQFIDVALSGGGLAEVTEQLAVSLEGAAVLGLGPDREIVTSAGPAEDVDPDQARGLDPGLAGVAAPLQGPAAGPEPAARAGLGEEDGLGAGGHGRGPRPLHRVRGQHHVGVDPQDPLARRPLDPEVALGAALGAGAQGDQREPLGAHGAPGPLQVGRRAAVEDLLRRHAAPPRPRGRTRRAAEGAVPRRAHDGSRPPYPRPDVGHHP